MAQITTKKINELRPGDNFEFVVGDVVEIGEQKPFGEGQHLQQTTIADETGATARFTLFDKPENEFTVGDTVKFFNGFVKEFGGNLTLNLTKKPDSKYEVLEHGDGTTKIKVKAKAGTFDPILGSRQTAVQVAGRIHAGTSTGIKELLEYAEQIEAWLTRP